MAASDVPVVVWVLIGVAASLLILGLLHYFANPKYISVQNKVYLITGGSSGIGKAAAKVRGALSGGPRSNSASRRCFFQDILRQGGRVALVARKQQGLDGTFNQCVCCCAYTLQP